MQNKNQNVLKFMKQDECNKLPEDFENEWSRRLVKRGDGYRLRNLNDLTVQRTVHLKGVTGNVWWLN